MVSSLFMFVNSIYSSPNVQRNVDISESVAVNTLPNRNWTGRGETRFDRRILISSVIT